MSEKYGKFPKILSDLQCGIPRPTGIHLDEEGAKKEIKKEKKNEEREC